MIPDTQSVVSRNSISEEDEEVQKPAVEEKVKEKSTEPDSSSWYDFLNPFSDDKEEEKPELKKKEEVDSDDSSWYDFLNPFSSNEIFKKERKNYEA